jgi:hypothetical protein
VGEGASPGRKEESGGIGSIPADSCQGFRGVEVMRDRRISQGEKRRESPFSTCKRTPSHDSNLLENISVLEVLKFFLIDERLYFHIFVIYIL